MWPFKRGVECGDPKSLKFLAWYFSYLIGEGNGNPLLVSLTGESHGGRSLVGYNPWGRKELDNTEWLNTVTSYKWNHGIFVFFFLAYLFLAMFLRFIHVVLCIRISLFWGWTKTLYIYVHFVYSFIKGHLSYFHLLAIVNNIVTNIGLEISVWIPDFSSLGIYPKKALLNHMLILWLISYGPHTVFDSSCIILHSH